MILMGDTMNIQVKIFDEEHESDLEMEVNSFLETIDPHEFIDVKYSINAFLSSTGEQIYCYSALIVYRSENKANKISQMIRKRKIK